MYTYLEREYNMGYISELTKKIFEKLDSEDSEELEETSTSGGAGGYETPFAFVDLDNKKEKDEWEKDATVSTGYKVIPKNESLYKKVMAQMSGLNEASYRDFKKDPTSTPAQKVNRSIMEVNRMLAEIERVVGHNVKLKLETGVDSSHFWKGTSKRFGRIGERLIKISNKLKELSQ